MSKPEIVLEIELTDDGKDYCAHLQGRTNILEPQDIDDWSYYQSMTEAIRESAIMLMKIADRIGGRPVDPGRDAL